MKSPIQTEETPAPQGSGVWLPTHLAQKFFHCFYGNGPRADGSVPHAEAPSTPQFPVQNPTDQFQVPTIQKYRDLHPQGVARKEPSS